MLLNNCPKLTHLSLTGVQAFLREELLAYCREAPPEFNEHQRDVFCVFSGTGVARLREFLNEQKAHALLLTGSAAGSATPSVVAGDDGGSDDMDDAVSDAGSSTPVMVGVDVGSQFPPGATPVVGGPSSASPTRTTPSGLLFAGGGNPSTWTHSQTLQHALDQHHRGYQAQHHHGGHGSGAATASSFTFSQSAPASTHPNAQWAAASSSSGAASGGGVLLPTQFQQQDGGGAGASGNGVAQHVTGMMGATILDDVDEGDEAFGEGSEIMGD